MRRISHSNSSIDNEEEVGLLPCPLGAQPKSLHYVASFEKGLPFPNKLRLVQTFWLNTETCILKENGYIILLYQLTEKIDKLQFQKENNQNPVVIKGYANGLIKLADQECTAPILLETDSIKPFNLNHLAELDLPALKEAISTDIEILIIGTGKDHQILSPKVIHFFNQHGIALEVMATRPACHTFQVLVHEYRKVAALLIP